MNETQKTLNHLQRDIDLIKDAIKSNNTIIRSIIGGPRLGSFFFNFGLATLLLPLLWDFMINRFGSVRVIPKPLFFTMLIFTIASLIILAVCKIRSVEKAAKSIDSNYRWIDIVESIFEHPIFLHQPLLMLFTIFASIISIQRGAVDLVVPIIALGLATIYMLYATVFLFSEYSALTIYLYVFSALVILFPVFSPLVMASIGFGGGFIVFGIAVHDFKGRRSET